MESNRTAQLAALAAKAARITRAAATAGAPGATAEVVKQFLPQLIKIAAVALMRVVYKRFFVLALCSERSAVGG
ncbi:hypothetical protein FACS18949_04810 [Clostridia bacterium]|nr:hypothetical protein FACS189425_10340 [Clostridia bacterium]GHV32779.1 hypothetical protein FACS18949_04810 [Clostridia bacterium]